MYEGEGMSKKKDVEPDAVGYDPVRDEYWIMFEGKTYVESKRAVEERLDRRISVIRDMFDKRLSKLEEWSRNPRTVCNRYDKCNPFSRLYHRIFG